MTFKEVNKPAGYTLAATETVGTISADKIHRITRMSVFMEKWEPEEGRTR